MIPMKLLRADSGTDMEKLVAAELMKGFDLYGPLVTAHVSILGQWMVQTYPHHEYRLVQAKAFHELERDVLSLQAEGYDFFHITTEWHGNMFQWMFRAVERDLAFQARTYTTYIPEQTDPIKLQVVEHVQGLLKMVPYPVDSPSALHRSTEGA